MSTAPVTIDTVRPNRFHYRVALFTAGGMFIDGYVLGVLTIALPALPATFGLDDFWKGLIGAAALMGLFVGSLLGGPVIDRFGRRQLYLLDLTAFTALSVLQFFVTDPAQLFVVRVLLGVAIGIDYAVGPAYLTEFMPTKVRGPVVGSLATWWRLGFLAALVVGTGLIAVDPGPDVWRWILVSATVPAVIVLMLRLGIPESPRWLAQRGRREEAERIVAEYIGPDVQLTEPEAEPVAAHPWRQLASRRWRGRILFMGFFWLCQVAPGAALTTFLPFVFGALGVEAKNTATVVQYVFVTLGGIAGLFFINRIGRRKLLIGTFWACGITLVALTLLPRSAVVPIVLLICFYGVMDAWGGNLQHLYPSELFPTELRASAAGTAAAISRIGSITATFLLPFVLDGFGVTVVILICAGFAVMGALASTVYAPETTGLDLSETTRRFENRPLVPWRDARR